MKLLDDIIVSVTETKEPISDILRRCLVLAYKLKNDTLKTWVEKELNGYHDNDELPSYRKTGAQSKGLFFGYGGSQLSNQPLPRYILDPEHREFASSVKLHQPIAAYENNDHEKRSVIEWPQDLVVKYQSQFYEGMALNRAWVEISSSAITGLLDTVRTRVLTFALQIQAELPSGEEAGVEAIPPAVVERMVHVNIYGGNNVLGPVQEFHAKTVLPGHEDGLRSSLAELGVTDGEIQELIQNLGDDGVLVEEGEEISEPKKPGNKTLQWISKTAQKIGSSGVKLGAAVAEEAIKRAVFGYLGM